MSTQDFDVFPHRLSLSPDPHGVCDARGHWAQEKRTGQRESSIARRPSDLSLWISPRPDTSTITGSI